MPDTAQITIAIDGFSSCGKSTLAQDLAQALHYLHIDSGAMYRAVALYLLRHDIPVENTAAVEQALPEMTITIEQGPSGPQTVLNGENVERDIRSLAVNRIVSPVSAISAVRRALVAQQRALGAQSGIVMDGRDIGTVVFPHAELKLFLTASLEVRIERRYRELLLKGMDASRDEVSRSITERDEMDSTRSDSPLRKADDAIVIDNTHLTREEQLEMAIELARERIDATRD
ncbi:MAG: (d)CMP kinase [Saprospiraceae bacterium]|nr:(d)CMP kinase [Saprospiraceae bacterium]